ncbi:MAG: D-amino acid aminotransferase [Proteobacteria bacterium]|nr:D-amino acid aminotransferase [Pseudomonadota bacterium]RZO98890.1 MAG: D-amino acid aminotransferase [Gammaproteobacteria bacterium]|tara:strand:- start:110 stop:958 length:849 start_codon:yes stop_codon:yes gene_type:complete
MTICYLNEDFIELSKASISPLDRGFLFGDSVYEVLAAYNKNLFRLDDHINRLNKNLEFLGINLNLSDSEIKSILKEVCLKNLEKNQIIYLQISRGMEEIRNHIPKEDTKPTLFICSFEMKNVPNENNETIKAILSSDIRWKKSSVKSTSLLANVLYKIKAQEEGVDELLMSDAGFITEGAVSNVFCVNENRIFTPPLDANILPGITRKVIIEIFEDLNLNFEEKKINEEFLFKSDELWITNTTKGILPIVELDKKVIGNGIPGKLFQSVKQGFLKKIEDCKV